MQGKLDFSASMGFWGMLLSLFMMICMAVFFLPEKTARAYYKSYVVLFALNAVTMLCDYTFWHRFDELEYIPLHFLHMVRPFSMVIDILILVVMSDITAARALEGKQLRRWRLTVTVLSLVGIVMLLTPGLRYLFYDIGDDRRMEMTPLFVLTAVPGAVILLGNLAVLLRNRKLLHPVVLKTELFSYLLLLTAIFVQQRMEYFPLLHLVQFAVIYLRLCGTQHALLGEAVQMEQEIENQKNRILIAQLEPHVLYNSLTAIMGIEGNPPATKKAISSFAKYLRGNLSMLEKDELIPVEVELEHVAQYLYLEELRFEERLHTEMDIREKGFRVPPLAVEMLVENAIRHGALVGSRSGTVKISTLVRGNTYVVRVEDDGPGFDTAILKQERPGHVGLKNIRERTQRMCGGTVSVESVPGTGTIAELIIPQEEAAL